MTVMAIPCKFECLRGNCVFPDVNQNSCVIRKQVQSKIKTKVYSHNKKSVEIGLLPLELDDMEQVFINATSNGFICPYCERPLDLWAKAGLWEVARAASVDHRIPIRSGKSTNHPMNLLLCCHECNTVKGVTDPVFWNTTVESIKKTYGLKAFWKYLDERYPQAGAIEIKNHWWGAKKKEEVKS